MAKGTTTENLLVNARHLGGSSLNNSVVNLAANLSKEITLATTEYKKAEKEHEHEAQMYRETRQQHEEKKAILEAVIEAYKTAKDALDVARQACESEKLQTKAVQEEVQRSCESNEVTKTSIETLKSAYDEKITEQQNKIVEQESAMTKLRQANDSLDSQLSSLKSQAFDSEKFHSTVAYQEAEKRGQEHSKLSYDHALISERQNARDMLEKETSKRDRKIEELQKLVGAYEEGKLSRLEQLGASRQEVKRLQEKADSWPTELRGHTAKMKESIVTILTDAVTQLRQSAIDQLKPDMSEVLQNLKTFSADAVIEHADYLDLLTKFDRAIDKMDSEMTTNMELFMPTRNAYERLHEEIKDRHNDLAREKEDIKASFTGEVRSSIMQEAFREQIDTVSKRLEGIQLCEQSHTASMKQIREEQATITTGLKSFEAALNAQGTELGNARSVVMDSMVSANDSRKAMKKAQQSFAAAIQPMGDSVQAIAEAKTGMVDGKAAFDAASKQLTDATDSMKESTTTLASVEGGFNTTTGKLDIISTSMTTATTELFDSKSVLDSATTKLDNSTTTVATALSESKNTLDAVATTLNETASAMTTANTAISDVKSSINSAASKLEKSASTLDESKTALRDQTQKLIDTQTATNSTLEKSKEMLAELDRRTQELDEREKALRSVADDVDTRILKFEATQHGFTRFLRECELAATDSDDDADAMTVEQKLRQRVRVLERDFGIMKYRAINAEAQLNSEDESSNEADQHAETTAGVDKPNLNDDMLMSGDPPTSSQGTRQRPFTPTDTSSRLIHPRQPGDTPIREEVLRQRSARYLPPSGTALQSSATLPSRSFSFTPGFNTTTRAGTSRPAPSPLQIISGQYRQRAPAQPSPLRLDFDDNVRDSEQVGFQQGGGEQRSTRPTAVQQYTVPQAFSQAVFPRTAFTYAGLPQAFPQTALPRTALLQAFEGQGVNRIAVPGEADFKWNTKLVDTIWDLTRRPVNLPASVIRDFVAYLQGYTIEDEPKDREDTAISLEVINMSKRYCQNDGRTGGPPPCLRGKQQRDKQVTIREAGQMNACDWCIGHNKPCWYLQVLPGTKMPVKPSPNFKHHTTAHFADIFKRVETLDGHYWELRYRPRGATDQSDNQAPAAS